MSLRAPQVVVSKSNLVKRPKTDSRAQEDDLRLHPDKIAAIRSSLKGLDAFETRAAINEFKKQARRRTQKQAEDFDFMVETLRHVVGERLLVKIVELEQKGQLPQSILHLLRNVHRSVLKEQESERELCFQQRSVSRGGFQDGAKVPGPNVRKVDRNKTRK